MDAISLQNPPAKRAHFALRRFLKLFTLGLIAAYGGVIVGLSYLYAFQLTRPVCPPPTQPPPQFQEITLTTADGLTLGGWWHPSQNGAAILLFPGWGGGRSSMLHEAQFLAEHGYGTATIDYRACVGEIQTLGYREVNEFNALLDFVLQQPEVSWVGACGFSVGGATVIFGAAARPEVRALVASGNYANLYNEITADAAVPLSPKWQIQQLVGLFFTLRTGIAPASISPIETLPKLKPRPVLLIHGEKEIQRTRGYAQQAAAGNNAALWVVPEADHGEYWQLAPQEYEQRVIEFFEAARAASSNSNVKSNMDNIAVLNDVILPLQP